MKKLIILDVIYQLIECSLSCYTCGWIQLYKSFTSHWKKNWKSVGLRSKSIILWACFACIYQLSLQNGMVERMFVKLYTSISSSEWNVAYQEKCRGEVEFLKAWSPMYCDFCLCSCYVVELVVSWSHSRIWRIARKLHLEMESITESHLSKYTTIVLYILHKSTLCQSWRWQFESNSVYKPEGNHVIYLNQLKVCRSFCKFFADSRNCLEKFIDKCVLGRKSFAF